MHRTVLLLFAVSVIALSQTGATYNAPTDRQVRPRPPLPTVGRAGTWLVDPTFGTRILRVTDNVNTLPGNPSLSFYTEAASYVNTFAVDSSAFFVRSDRGYQLFLFNPQSLVANRIGPLNLVSPVFSYRNPRIINGLSSRSLVQYDYVSGTTTTLLKLDTVVPSYPQDMGTVHVDDADNRFAVSFGGYQNTYRYVVVYDRSKDSYSLLDLRNSTINGRSTNASVAGGGVHSLTIDRSGRYVVLVLHGGSGGTWVWDTSTNLLTKVTVLNSGHEALGFGDRINQTGIVVTGSIDDAMGLSRRMLANPNSGLVQLISPPPSPPYQWGAGGHWSWNNVKANARNPIVGTFYRELWAISHPWKHWDDEIVAIRTDGVESKVWRIAHHRSIMTNNFWDSPRGNVSPDGRFYMFTSNWGKTLGSNSQGPRQDVFIVELPLAGDSQSKLSLTTVNPDTIKAGTAGATLKITGTGFEAGCRVRWNGTALATTHESDTSLQAVVPQNLLATAGTASIAVRNPDGEESNGISVTVSPQQPASPAISALSPASATAGGPAFTLTVSGSQFVSGAGVRWNGTALMTTFVSGTSLQAAVPQNLIATAGAATITVRNPDGSVSNNTTFTVNAASTPPPPASNPAISRLSPIDTGAGGGSFWLTVNGSGFISGAAVRWNGTAVQTIFNSSAQVIGIVPGEYKANPGTVYISVRNPDGAVSNSVSFVIWPKPGSTPPPSNTIVPAISRTSPPDTGVGASSFWLTVYGSNFLSGAVVKWNGTAVQTLYSNSGQVIGIVPAGYRSNAGTVNITVVNPNGAVSNDLAFTIWGPNGENPPASAAPKISRLSPIDTGAGGGSFWLTVNGSNFVSGAVVRWNGTPVQTLFTNSGQVIGIVPGSYKARPGVAYISVANPGGAASNTVSFRIW